MQHDDEFEESDEYGEGEKASLLGTAETEVQCPFCGEAFSIVADTSLDEQAYIEDCYVCCRPIHFTIRCENGEVASVSADRE